LNTTLSKPPLLSPNFHQQNTRERLIRSAISNAISMGAIKDPIKRKENSDDPYEESLARLHDTFYSNRKVQTIAKK